MVTKVKKIEPKKYKSLGLADIQCLKRAQKDLEKTLMDKQDLFESISRSIDMSGIKSIQKSAEQAMNSISSGLGLLDLSEFEKMYNSVQNFVTPKEEINFHYAFEADRYQKQMHPLDAERTELILEKLEGMISVHKNSNSSSVLQEAEKSDFTFDTRRLFIKYKDQLLRALTSLEIITCNMLFAEPIGSRIPTMEVEEALYPGHIEGKARKEKTKKVVQRLNAKIHKQTGVKHYIVYSSEYISRST